MWQCSIDSCMFKSKDTFFYFSTDLLQKFSFRGLPSSRYLQLWSISDLNSLTFIFIESIEYFRNDTFVSVTVWLPCCPPSTHWEMLFKAFSVGLSLCKRMIFCLMPFDVLFLQICRAIFSAGFASFRYTYITSFQFLYSQFTMQNVGKIILQLVMEILSIYSVLDRC